MNKDNIFRSSKFYMSKGDVLHMIINDEHNVPLTTALYGELNEETPEAEPDVYGDYSLPSKDILNLMYLNLCLEGVGGFNNGLYWSSSENDNDTAHDIDFGDGSDLLIIKSASNYVRAYRSFISTIIYALKDIGPAGGLVFYRDGNNYLEAAPTDCADSVWSNVENIAIGTTGTAIGTGQANTTSIIGQVGHTTSAAKLCDDLIV